MEILLATITKIITQGTITQNHNTVEVFICIFCISAITLSKVYTRRTIDKAIILQSCILAVLPRHRSIIAHKGLNLFGGSAAKCLYMFPQEEERTYSC